MADKNFESTLEFIELTNHLRLRFPEHALEIDRLVFDVGAKLPCCNEAGCGHNLDFEEFNYANPFELKLTGGELESLLNLLDEVWIRKQSLTSELQVVRQDLHTYLSNNHRKADATEKAEKAV